MPTLPPSQCRTLPEVGASDGRPLIAAGRDVSGRRGTDSARSSGSGRSGEGDDDGVAALGGYLFWWERNGIC